MKKQKIAVICAHPSGTNLGMISVDASLHSLKIRLGNSVEFTRFCSWRSLSKGFDLNYNHYYSPDQLKEFDKIIFWGDFLHWIGYAKNDWVSKCKKMNMNISYNEMIDLWYSLFLLEDNKELQQKSILFGGTIYGLDSIQLTDNRYLNGLQNLIKNSLLVKTRDIMSSNFVSLIDPTKKNTFGCDCSLLFQPYYFSDNIQKSSSPYVLYSFARSEETEKLIIFSQSISNEFNINANKINWISKGACLNSLEKNINLIKGAKFVVTDIYHLAINSWREGTPAICIGRGNSYVQDSLSDKKKEIFYHQMLGLKYYLFLEDIINVSKNKKEQTILLKNIKNIILDEKSKQIIIDFLSSQKQKTLDDLIQTIIR